MCPPDNMIHILPLEYKSEMKAVRLLGYNQGLKTGVFIGSLITSIGVLLFILLK